ncbi:MAG: GntR family transcriptional regulator [Pseudomonadota bacterium]|nr:GntR family transcriptional regulator [Pseudomonadota bacterium]
MRSEFEPDVRAFFARAEALIGAVPGPPPTLPGHIAAWIADRIQFGDFKPRDSIRELTIADYFDVSRGPVREALRLLDRDGLVVLNGRKGAMVRDLSAEETDALFHIRAELFAAQAGLAASVTPRDPALISALGDGAKLLARIAAADNAPVGDYITVRRAISVLIASLSGANYMARLSAALEREVAVLWASVQNPDRRRRSAATWGGLCRAIENSRVGEAERLARDLVLDGLAEVQRRSETGEKQAASSPKRTRRR